MKDDGLTKSSLGLILPELDSSFSSLFAAEVEIGVAALTVVGVGVGVGALKEGAAVAGVGAGVGEERVS